ncbi:Glucanosyltransferase-domain-containing protein [Limtongia smithiae]|uniref:Glucanosyltransferase-domain-containing protein n=1 Tax=Limtongia smithiae TaxID=1125753 RepID=UPI0034CE6C71
MLLPRLVFASLCAAWCACALLPISAKDNMFVDYDGNPFVVVGVDYQPGGSSDYSDSASSDVLSDEDVCLRDAYLLQALGVNTIRVYTVSPWLNHDACMSILNAVGIYLLLDINSPLSGESLQRDDPANSYNSDYLGRVFAIADAFMGYQNLLGFISGNEVFNDATSAAVSPPYIRAVQRDLKNYIKRHATREIPVGYSSSDDSTLRVAGWEYLQCADNATTDSLISRSDFYGLNSYSWCSGQSTFQTSGYSTLQTLFADSAIPLFFSEYGCNAVIPRTFTEVNGGVYISSMLEVFDGGLVYEYAEEDNNYGLVTINSNGSVSLKQDYVNLQEAYANMTYETFISSSYINNVSTPACNSSYIESLDSSFNASFSLPTFPSDAESMMVNGSGNNNVGKWIAINNTQTTYDIYDVNGNLYDNTTITIVSDETIVDSTNTYVSSSASSTVMSSTTAPTSSVAASTTVVATTGATDDNSTMTSASSASSATSTTSTAAAAGVNVNSAGLTLSFGATFLGLFLVL